MIERIIVPLMLVAWCAPVLASHVVPGFVVVTPEGQMSLHFAARVPNDQLLFIQTPAADGNGRPLCCTRIPPALLQLMTKPQQLVSSVAGNPVISYVVSQPPAQVAWGENGFVGIAVSASKVTRAGGYAIAAHNRDEFARVRLCFGSEGLNLISKTRNKVSALYLTFGYGVDQSPKCNAEDLRDLELVSE